MFEETPHGFLVRLDITADDQLFDSLFPEERSLATKFAEKRRRTFAAGRVALRRALEAAGFPSDQPILRDDRGAPILPNGAKASVTHTDELACAICSSTLEGFVGIDLESISRVADLGGRLILTAEELDLLPALPEERDLELGLKFSLKESLYKALDPFVRRYVGFKEVECWPRADGSARFGLLLKHGEGPFSVQGRWRREGDRVLTTVHVARS